MQSTFHDEERQPRTVLRARPATQDRVAETDADRERVIGAIITALVPFPEARRAVIAAIEASETGSGLVE